MGQINLVPNPSFEDTVQCPAGSAHIEDAVGWYSAGLSPDYYNSCANAGGYINGVPDNWTGHHIAYNGSSYAGIITYHVYSLKGSREDIGVLLTQPLTIGMKYFVSAYISRSDTIFYADTLKCSSNKFGFRFSTIQFFPWPTDNFSHVHSDSIITDNINWTRFAGSFIADSAYKYLIIGNFYDDAHTDTAQCHGGYAYYLIDEVCVSTDSLTCSGNVGIHENREPVFNIFPNPVRDVLNISYPFIKEQYSIIDATGKIIMKGVLDGKSNLLNITTIGNGIYFLKINKIKSYKIIIIH